MDDQQQPVTVPIETRPRPRARQRWVAGIAAAMMVLALGSIGGYAVGDHVQSSDATAPPQQNSALGNDWGRQHGGAGTLPFGGGSLPGDGTQPGSATTATVRQTTGLVRIVSTLGYQDGEAAGTGMILTSDGEVVTNHHVVAGATGVKATVMSTGR